MQGTVRGAFCGAGNAGLRAVLERQPYGNLNLDFELVNAVNRTGPTRRSIAYRATSRFGIRGVEYLGAGNAAIFQIESNVQADTGNAASSGLASRETFVGAQGDWGTFRPESS